MLTDFDHFSSVDHRLEDIVVLHQKWNARSHFSYAHGRPDNGLIWVRAGVFYFYCTDGVTVAAHEGDLVYTPLGTKYEAEFAKGDVRTEDTLIHFQVYNAEGETVVLGGHPQILVSSGGARWQEQFDAAEEAFEAVRGKLRLKECLYHILDQLCSYMIPKIDNGYRTIANGIDLLENHLSENIPVGKLAQACCVSERTFRRVFLQYAGMSPVQYRNSIRIARARQLLRSGDLTVGEIAEKLGFYDASYFCRFFRQHVGCWPGDYAWRPKELPL